MYPAEAALKALLDQRAEKTFPALAMAIGKGDKLIWQAAAGYADAKNHLRATPETLFGIGSITKVFVAVIILQLVEEGSLTLDAFLADWLAEESLAGVANAETVTVRQLLAQYPAGKTSRHGFMQRAVGRSNRIRYGCRRKTWTLSGGKARSASPEKPFTIPTATLRYWVY